MNLGMLWLTDSRLSLIENIKKAMDYCLNKYGKALIEAHETPNKRESDVAAEINATQGAA